MITLSLVSAALTAACYTTAHRSIRRRVQDIAMVLGTGFMGVFIVALCGALFAPPEPWAFPLIFTFGMGVELRIIRRRRVEADRQRMREAFPLGPRREGHR